MSEDAASPVSGQAKKGVRKSRAKAASATAAPARARPIAKEAIAAAAEVLGGAERLAAWAREDPKNEHSFWTGLYPKLLPLQVTGEGGGPVLHRIERTIVDPKA